MRKTVSVEQYVIDALYAAIDFNKIAGCVNACLPLALRQAELFQSYHVDQGDDATRSYPECISAADKTRWQSLSDTQLVMFLQCVRSQHPGSTLDSSRLRLVLADKKTFESIKVFNHLMNPKVVPGCYVVSDLELEVNEEWANDDYDSDEYEAVLETVRWEHAYVHPDCRRRDVTRQVLVSMLDAITPSLSKDTGFDVVAQHMAVALCSADSEEDYCDTRRLCQRQPGLLKPSGVLTRDVEIRNCAQQVLTYQRRLGVLKKNRKYRGLIVNSAVAGGAVKKSASARGSTKRGLQSEYGSSNDKAARLGK